ncbi:MAG: hypothetical protein FWC54_04420, partial [Actinomycetia bacterium]|nr:hypothetical protein [Actinomycetes bacterium]
NCFIELPVEYAYVIPNTTYKEVIRKLKPEEALVQIDTAELVEEYSGLPEKEKGKFLARETTMLARYAKGITIDASKRTQAGYLIHGASAIAGTVGAVPIPIADAIPISAAQISMIVGLGRLYGEMNIPKTAVAGMTAAIAASMAGRQFVKLIPGAGSVVGAGTAIAITEALGWFVVINLERGKSIEDIAKDFQPNDVLKMVKSTKSEVTKPIDV